MTNLRALWAVFFLTSSICHGQQSLNTALSRPAEFRVTTEVVNENVLPFAATVGGVGNSLINEGGGFEPIVYRNRYLALENSPNRILVKPETLSQYDSLRDGFLNGATVWIYRIENGKFRMVRQDQVAPDGFHVSGWNRAIDQRMILSPENTRFSYRWSGWNRPNVKYYFTVRAIDKDGNLSAPASAVEFNRPDKVGKGSVSNPLISFKPTLQTSILNKLIGKQETIPSSVSAPKNLRGNVDSDGLLTLQWDPVNDSRIAGYITYQSDYPQNLHKGYFIQLSKPPASSTEHVKAGDLIVVSKKIYTPSRNNSLSNRVWGAEQEYKKILPGLLNNFPDEEGHGSWQLVPHEPGTTVDAPGETYLKIQLAAGEKQSLETYNISGTAQYWYDVLEKKPYKVEAWLRQEGTGTIKFKVGGFYSRPPQNIDPIEFQAGRNWKKHVATFTPSTVHTGSDTGNMSLELTGPGTFYVDNFRVYRGDTDFLDFSLNEYDAIKSAHLLSLRTHSLISTKTRSYDIEQLTNPGGVISGSREKPNTLPQLLKLFHSAKVQPWLQIEFHLSPQEWLAFIEYMAAPFDPKRDTPQSKPWAFKRYAQGQLHPWVNEFDNIFIELSNETWNRLFAPWTFEPMPDASNGKTYTAGQTYGMFQEHVINTMKSSPYWRQANLDNKFKFVLGGWSGLPYGADAASTSPSSNLMTIAAYNGGWDEGEGPPKFNAASLFDVLSQVNQSAIPIAERHAKEIYELREKGNPRIQAGTYEAGPGYALNGLNGARVTEDQNREQEQVMKSLAAGTATLDAFLARAYRGFEIQNFFTFGSGNFWRSHAKWHFGGQAYPSWKALALFNIESTGDMLKTETLSVPSTPLRGFDRRPAIKDAPLVSTYATRNEKRFSLFVLSRKVPDFPNAEDDGFTPVSVELPFSRADSISLYRMTGDVKANNLMSDNIQIEKTKIPVGTLGKKFVLNKSTGADERGLPPASTFLYVFEGVNLPDKKQKSSLKGAANQQD